MASHEHTPAQPHPLVSDPDYVAGLGALRDAVGTAADHLAACTGLVLFTPACVVAGRLGEGLAHLEAAGFTVTWARRVVLTELQVRRVWRLQSASFAPERWRVAVRLFCAGPSVVAIVTAPTGAHDPPAAARLRALKGPSDPDALAPHHLRKRLGAPNKINNLVHSADSPHAVVREAWLLLAPDALRSGWSAARSGRRLDDVDRFVEANVGPARRDSVSLAHVGVRLLWRAFDLARSSAGAGDSGPEPSDRAGAAGALRASLAAQLAWTRDEPADDAADAIRRWRARYGASPTAPAFRACAGEGRLARAYRGVEDVLAGRPVALPTLERDLSESGLAPDRWERLVLASEVVSQQIRASESAAAGPRADSRRASA